MKCQFCDNALKPGATSCDACGAPVEQAEQSQPTNATVYEIPPAPAATTVDDFLPPAQVSDTPPAYSASPYSPPEKSFFGLPASNLGIISLILGIVGIALSCVGCGGILSLVGLAAGFYSLKTSSRQQGVIGMVLSGIGLVLTVALMCFFLSILVTARNSG